MIDRNEIYAEIDAERERQIGLVGRNEQLIALQGALAILKLINDGGDDHIVNLQRYFNMGLTYKEIAKRLDVDVSTACYWLGLLREAGMIPRSAGFHTVGKGEGVSNG